jgi:hypothetical protein
MQKNFIQESRLGVTLVLFAGALSPIVIGQCLTSVNYNACAEYPEGTFECDPCSVAGIDECCSYPSMNGECGDAVPAAAGLSAEESLAQATCTWQQSLCPSEAGGACTNGGTSTSVRNCEKATGATCPTPPGDGGGGGPIKMILPE